MDSTKEIIIVGAGPAGITAGIYLKRAGFHPLILEKNTPGGLLKYAHLVENYPGFPKGITGKKLAECFVEQLHTVKLSVTNAIVEQITVQNEMFYVKTNHGCFTSSVVIVATGTSPKKLTILGTVSTEGKHLFYDPWSLPKNNQNQKKRILVIGGGDIAFDYALTLHDQGNDVCIICRSKPRCLPLLEQRVSQAGITVHTMLVPEEIFLKKGKTVLRCRWKTITEEFSADYLLVACGRSRNTSLLSPKLKKNLFKNQCTPETSIPGLYLVGDVAHETYRQVGIAVGDGIHAAMITENYLKNRVAKP